MKYRKLRIALSAVCAVACLLLMALWARSYKWAEIIVRHVSTTQIRIDSGAGFVAIKFSDKTLRPKWINMYADHFVGFATHTYATEFPASNRKTKIWGHFQFSLKHRGLCVPYWFLSLSAAAAAAASLGWLRFRFSLRTLLIGVTLIAMLLGLIVYTNRG
jgi:hypothetical protein